MNTIWHPDSEAFKNLAQNQPKYMALAELIEAAIEAKKLIFEQRLPAQRTLADELGITHGTVTRAYVLLEQRGLVSAKLGAGTYVSKRSSSAAIHGVSDLASSVQPSMGQDMVMASVMKSLSHSVADLDEVMTYKINGLDRHQRFYREWLKQKGFECEQHDLVFTQGAQQGIFACLSALCEPQDLVLHESLTYPGFLKACESLHLQYQGVPVQEDGIDLQALESLCQKHPVKAIYITPNCQNPTNIRYSDEKLSLLLAMSRKYHFFILEDDVNYCLPENWRLPLWQQASDRVFYIASFSKYFSGGLRVGYVLAPLLWQQQVINAIHAQCWSVSMMNFELLMRALQGKEYEYVQNKLAEELRCRQRTLQSLLERFDFHARFAGLNVCLMLPDELNMHYMTAHLKGHSVLVRSLDVFSSRREPTALNGIRFTLGGPSCRAEFDLAMTRLQAALSQLSERGDVVI
ncbi:PLP-dependent aminotransferase family protein [Pseudoalteromonas luteoviolacea]|uniref:HTH gntR-type domain-containing protein n=1 Tax=Pseudoalteromonas luteoviolacea NCIMB 1942 TaxID=1365253 RepID=A0A167C687_9GAMM|nr:PLP-dependent aminotransferase family protein [Pseudoalteromonas luteoviolacea]KZN47284.1 hypothetical protein N482_10230 [Pseudoalteromonas luteoviolacea NCIMB 1942]KZX01652.1 hypothetical protein JL49_04675 [Pseudoalteromonas luteoviolacea]